MKRALLLAAVLGFLLTAGPAVAQTGPAASATLPTTDASDAAVELAARSAKQKALHAKRRARRAITAARTAKRLARRAIRRVRTTRSIARSARDVARQASARVDQTNTRVDQLEARLDQLAIVTATEPGAVSTASVDEFVSLGGPAVTATVPDSGMIEVWATVTFDDPSDGLVALYEDGERVPLGGQQNLCGSDTIAEDVLLMAALGPELPITLSTPPAPSFGLSCGVAGPAGAPVLLTGRTPGEHTYELRYADCGCFDEDASFSDRTLRVAGRS